MSAGMSQSVALPREMLEALGDYRGALKDVKSELKDLEKEAKRIEKQGGVISPGLRSQIESARGARSRLEDRVMEQKIARSNQRKLAQYKGEIASAFYAPGSYLSGLAMRSFLGTATGRAAQRAALKAQAYAGAKLAKARTFSYAGRSLSISRGAMLSTGAAVAGTVQAYYSVKTEREKMRARGFAGAGKTEEFLTGTIKNLGYGDVMAQDFGAITALAKSEAAAAKEVINKGSLLNYAKTLMFGDTQAGQDMEDKLIQNSIRRSAKARRYGSGYADAIDVENIKRKRKFQYDVEMFKEMGFIDYVVNRVATTVGARDRGEYVAVGHHVIKAITFGALRPGSSIAKAEIAVNEKMTALNAQKWEQERADNIRAWNETETLDAARKRAFAHERSNAVTQYEADRLTRGLVWSL